MYSVTKIVEFHTAHRLLNYKGACHNIHGHSYKAHITIESEELNHENMVIDFKDLKKVIEELTNEWDHALFVFVGEKDLMEYCKKADIKIVECPQSNTSAEMMAEILYKHIDKHYRNSEIKVKKVRIYETDTSYADYYEK